MSFTLIYVLLALGVPLLTFVISLMMTRIQPQGLSESSASMTAFTQLVRRASSLDGRRGGRQLRRR